MYVCMYVCMYVLNHLLFRYVRTDESIYVIEVRMKVCMYVCYVSMHV